MRTLRLLEAGLLLLAGWPAGVAAQNWGTVAGRVSEAASGAALPGVTVLVDGTNFGTATNVEGAYELRLPVGRYALRFSAIGFRARVDSVVVRRDQTTRLDVALADVVVELEGVTVEDAGAPREAGVYDLSPEQVQNIPAPFRDGFRALKVLPGVATNNELSNQYSVRGGGFNENLIFINGFEVYLPFRPRQGEQEGLGLLNPELADRITLYTGGFPARYGGKLSSALEVTYHRPEREPLSGAAYASTLDAGATARASALDGRLGWSFGVRKARARRFFETQELEGNYQPDYTDLQGYLAYRLAPGHEWEALGMWADHDFLLDPRSRKTYFGTVSADPTQPSNLQAIWVSFDEASEERDGYATRFFGTRLKNRLSPSLRIEHDVAYFETDEREYLRLRGSSILYQVDPGSGDPDAGTGHIETGGAVQEDLADNRVRVKTWTGQGRWRLTRNRHAAEAGWLVRALTFSDRLQEQTTLRGRSTDGDVIRIVADSLYDSAALDATQAGFYVQDAVDLLPTRDRLVVTGGVRADYFSFNGEWTVSPRLSARYRLTTRTTLNGAAGVYHQAPTYRELRGQPEPGEGILGALNRGLKAQRSVQFVGGLEHLLARRRLYLRAEAYYKRLTNLISYDIENVRVLYSGENDAEGYVYGLDLQLRGEFVPGLESWVNYGFMVARERLLPAFQTPLSDGVVPRPTDQRHTLSVFVQDYVPNDDTWKIHLRGLLGTGLPYTPPIPGRRIGTLVVQVPGERFSARYPLYRRLDLGVTKNLIVDEREGRRPIRLRLTAEILNVFDMTNTIAYAWVPRADGVWQRIPTRLTPRTINVRARVEF